MAGLGYAVYLVSASGQGARLIGSKLVLVWSTYGELSTIAPNPLLCSLTDIWNILLHFGNKWFPISLWLLVYDNLNEMMFENLFNNHESKVHGANMGPTGPRWVTCWPHELWRWCPKHSNTLFQIDSWFCNCHSKTYSWKYKLCCKT